MWNLLISNFYHGILQGHLMGLYDNLMRKRGIFRAFCYNPQSNMLYRYGLLGKHFTMDALGLYYRIFIT